VRAVEGGLIVRPDSRLIPLCTGNFNRGEHHTEKSRSGRRLDRHTKAYWPL